MFEPDSPWVGFLRCTESYWLGLGSYIKYRNLEVMDMYGLMSWLSI